MKQLPSSEKAVLIRTDFADDTTWKSLCEVVRQPSEEGFVANVECVSDPAYDRLTIDQLIALKPRGTNVGEHVFAFIADRKTLAGGEMPVLVIDLHDELGRIFRVVANAMWCVENNLAIANMDFSEFATHVDADGVFRGFPYA